MNLAREPDGRNQQEAGIELLRSVSLNEASELRIKTLAADIMENAVWVTILMLLASGYWMVFTTFGGFAGGPSAARLRSFPSFDLRRWFGHGPERGTNGLQAGGPEAPTATHS